MPERDPNADPDEAAIEPAETDEQLDDNNGEPEQQPPVDEGPGDLDEEPQDLPPDVDEPEEPAPQAPPRPAPRTGRRGEAKAERTPVVEQLRIAFIGGTGPEGLGLAMRFARSGNMVYIGSRTEERALEAVAKVKEIVPNGDVFGGLNREGAERANVVFITVPSDAHEATLTDLADAIGDKVLVDCVVPMVFDNDGPRALDLEDGSAAEQARRLIPEAKVISAFHHLDGGQLQKIDKPLQGDVIVCGDHKAAKKQVMDLVEQIEWVRALDAGALANARYLENWTVVLIHLNKIYKAHSGIRITGI